MPSRKTDPLLAAARVIVVLAQIVIIFGMVMLGIGIGALLTVGRAKLMAEIGTAGAPPMSFWLIVLAMLTGMGVLGLANRFLKELTGIIKSVDQGDPFAPENATRLNRMGWIMVTGQLLVLPVAGLALWLAPYIQDAAEKGHLHGQISFGPDGGMILLTLILFILARVFRRGTEMREELEGTV